MKQKNVEMIATPREPHFVGDGFRVQNFIPSYPRMDMKRMDPFIMLDYNAKYNFPPSKNPKGVGVHPHRGFETVTIAYQGKIEHHDSSGGGGIIGKGEVQWMTAGSGVLHKEYHETEWSKKGGIFQMVQLWVNLPSQHKMTPPKYQAITQNKMTQVELPQNSGYIEVIAGEFNGAKGNAQTFSPIEIYNLKINENGKADFMLPAHYNTALLVIEGDVNINNSENAPADHLVLMANDGEKFSVEANENSIVLILSGEPLNEPIAAHGPFVMNTKEELIEAFNDFNTGKFGYLAD